MIISESRALETALIERERERERERDRERERAFDFYKVLSNVGWVLLCIFSIGLIFKDVSVLLKPVCWKNLR